MDAAVSPHALIIGAGPAGLAVAALLGRADVPYLLLEGQRLGASWRGHYDRLHLHTARRFSGLPGLPMPRTYPAYPSRDQVVAYLEAYARHFGIRPREGQRVMRAARGGERWQVTTEQGEFSAPVLVVASGYSRRPHRPHWPGMETFAGPMVHSADYRNGRPFRGQRVLVVGLGNSGAELALDLHGCGARPSVSVRRAVNVLPRDVLGVPTLALGLLQQRWPAPLADAVNAPVIRALIGDLRPYGLARPARGATEELRRDARVPVLDVGTVALIRSGEVPVRPGIERFTPAGVVFTDGREEAFGAVVLATGFTPGLEWLQTTLPVLNAAGRPTHSGVPAHEPGLYFCGFHVSPTGMLREIGREARQIAAQVVAGQTRPEPAGEPQAGKS